MAWRPGFLGWLAIALAVLLLPLLALALWSRTSGDLERFARHATERGFAIDWRNHPASGPPSETLLALRRLVQLQAGLKTYAEDQGEPDPGDPIPAALLDHHRGLPAEDVRAWEETAQRLRQMPRTCFDLDRHGLWTDIDELSNMWAFAGERIRCADPTHLVDAVANYTGLLHSLLPRTSHDMVSLSNQISAWIRLVLLRRDDLAGHQEEVAAICDHLAETIPDDTLAALANNHIPFLLAWQEAQRRNEPLFLERWGNVQLPSVLMTPGLDRLIIRSGRGEVLDRQLRRAALARTTHDLQAVIRQDLIDQGEMYSAHRYHLRTWYVRGMGYHWYWHTRIIFSSWIQLRLLAADLRGQPWPIDPWDPTGARLRPWIRDGVFAGAYSVGQNGIDDHGRPGFNFDICFELVARKPAPP